VAGDGRDMVTQTFVIKLARLIVIDIFFQYFKTDLPTKRVLTQSAFSPFEREINSGCHDTQQNDIHHNDKK
jgi:hypothetical protein